MKYKELIMKSNLIAAGAILALAAGAAIAQDKKIRVIAFGAHPDDADIRCGGVAAKFAARGHLVLSKNSTELKMRQMTRVGPFQKGEPRSDWWRHPLR